MNLLDRNLLIKRCFIRRTLSPLWANLTYKRLLTWTQNKSNRNLGHWIKITKSAVLIHFQKWEFLTSRFDCTTRLRYDCCYVRSFWVENEKVKLKNIFVQYFGILLYFNNSDTKKVQKIKVPTFFKQMFSFMYIF